MGGRGGELALWAVLAGLGLDALANDLEDFRPLWVLFGLIGASPSETLAPGRHLHAQEGRVGRDVESAAIVTEGAVGGGHAGLDGAQ